MTKKAKISFLILVWSIVAVQIYVNYQTHTSKEENVVTAFSVMNNTIMGVTIKGYGCFGTMNISKDIKEKMLENLAVKLGITDEYEITQEVGDSYEKMILNKKGKYADTLIQILSRENKKGEEEQYIFIEIQTTGELEHVYNLYKKVKRIYGEIGIEGNVSLEIELRRAGNEIKNENSAFIEELFDIVKAKRVEDIQENGIYTVYGYTWLEDSYLQFNQKKVNVQVVMAYDEREDITYIKVGVPIVNSSY